MTSVNACMQKPQKTLEQMTPPVCCPRSAGIFGRKEALRLNWIFSRRELLMRDLTGVERSQQPSIIVQGDTCGMQEKLLFT